MKCPFCAAENAPKAKFCNECGSPLYLQICPKCETTNDRAAVSCMKCGHVLAAQDDSVTVTLINPGGTLEARAPGSVDDAPPAAKASPKGWKDLLHEVEEEVHRQLDTQTSDEVTVARPAGLQPAAPIAPLAPLPSVPAARIAAIIEPSRRSHWTLSGLLLLVAGGGAAAYYLLSPALRIPATPQPVAKSASVQVMTGSIEGAGTVSPRAEHATRAQESASAAVAARPLAPAPGEEKNHALPGEPKTEAAQVVALPVPAPAVDAAPEQTTQSKPAQVEPPPKKAPARLTTVRATRSISPGTAQTVVDREEVIKAPVPKPVQPALPANTPCTEGMQALALCAGQPK